MPKDENLIEAEILAYIRAIGGSESDWYVALAGSARECLFERHSVAREEDRWIYRKAFTEEAARRIVNYLRNELGTDGQDCADNGDELVYICVYKKSENTTP